MSVLVDTNILLRRTQPDHESHALAVESVALLLLLAVEGMAMYAVFAYVEVYFTRWAFRSSMSAAG